MQPLKAFQRHLTKARKNQYEELHDRMAEEINHEKGPDIAGLFIYSVISSRIGQ